MLRLLGALLLIGAIVTGCTSQEGSKGPSHPASQTGAPDGGIDLNMVAQVGPGQNQFQIIVLVESAAGGRPLQGVIVTLVTTAGRLNPTRGSTDAIGVFRSILTCDDGGAGSTVIASVEGVQAVVTVCGAPAGVTPPPTPPA